MDPSSMESVDTLLTADLRSSSNQGFSPRGQGVQAHPRDALDQELDRIRYEIEWLRAQNYLIRKQLRLAQENSDLKSASIIADILKWLEDGKRPQGLDQEDDYLGEQALNTIHNSVVHGEIASQLRSRSLSPKRHHTPPVGNYERTRSTSPEKHRVKFDESSSPTHVVPSDDGMDGALEPQIPASRTRSRRGSIVAWYPAGDKDVSPIVAEADSGSYVRLDDPRPRHGDSWVPSRHNLSTPSPAGGPPIASSTPLPPPKEHFTEIVEPTFLSSEQAEEAVTAHVDHPFEATTDKPGDHFAKRMSSMELLDKMMHKEELAQDTVGCGCAEVEKDEKCACEPVASGSKKKPGKGDIKDYGKRILGEICFQLDRRILNYIFNGREPTDKSRRRRFYGFTLNNIASMIHCESTDDKSGAVDVKAKLAMSYRYQYVFHILKHCGYNLDFHPHFATHMVNKYGLLNYPLGEKSASLILQDPTNLHSMVETLPKDDHEVTNMKIILDCLILLANDDGKPIFIW